MPKEPLPIDMAPKPISAIPADQLGKLNAALYLAQLRAAEARELDARLALARIEASHTVAAFETLRGSVGSTLGVALGETHGWDAATGEVGRLQRG